MSECVCVCCERPAARRELRRAPPEPEEDQRGPVARAGGGGVFEWLGVCVRARAAENQEVTAAKRTQTCLIAVT